MYCVYICTYMQVHTYCVVPRKYVSVQIRIFVQADTRAKGWRTCSLVIVACKLGGDLLAIDLGQSTVGEN